MEALIPRVAQLRTIGAYALDLAYVAAGRLDAFWLKKLCPWSIAAGILLIREAGGLVDDLAKGDSMLERREIIAGNERLYHSLLRVLKKTTNSPTDGIRQNAAGKNQLLG